MKIISLNRILIAAFMFLIVAFLFSCQKETSSKNSNNTISETDAANYSDESAQADGSFDGPGSVVSNPEVINPGKTATLTFTPTTPGTYKFRCDIHPDQMTGTITVE